MPSPCTSSSSPLTSRQPEAIGRAMEAAVPCRTEGRLKEKMRVKSRDLSWTTLGSTGSRHHQHNSRYQLWSFSCVNCSAVCLPFSCSLADRTLLTLKQTNTKKQKQKTPHPFGSNYIHFYIQFLCKCPLCAGHASRRALSSINITQVTNLSHISNLNFF